MFGCRTEIYLDNEKKHKIIILNFFLQIEFGGIRTECKVSRRDFSLCYILNFKRLLHLNIS